MKFEFFIAKRYLLKGRKTSFISIISLVSIIGITIGVAALIIALSLINGFQNDIKSKILNSTSHIMINNIIGDGLEGHDQVIKMIKSRFKDIKSISPIVSGTVLIKSGARKTYGAILWGMDLDSAKEKTWLKQMANGQLPFNKNDLILGENIADKLNLFKNDSCILVTPQPVLSPYGIMPKIKKVTISGIFKSGLYEVDNGTVITNLKTAQKLFNLKDKISFIQVYLKDAFDSEKVAAKLKEILPYNLQVTTWKDLNASLYSALDLEKTIMFFTLTLIIIVASLNIIAGLILLVIQKIKDIGILLSYGATPKMIKKIFFIQGGIIGILGTSAGVIVGTFFCYLANTFEWIKVPAEIYQMSHVPFTLGTLDLIKVITVSLIISFTATIIPSIKAASINVVDAIKNE
jgi:lipoprotein-releasing system permease protein